MTPPTLYTDRLDIIPASLDDLRAEGESPAALAARLGVAIGPGWPPGEHDRDARQFFVDRMAEGGAAAEGWYAWYAIRRATEAAPALAIGAVGYHGPPDANGVVEIGFSVLESLRGRGYATEAAQALIVHAFAAPAVTRVIAHTDAANEPSQRVLESCGLRRTPIDPAPGRLRYELPR